MGYWGSTYASGPNCSKQWTPTEEPPSGFVKPVWGYAKAMREVYRRHAARDMDVVTLTADALMNTNPWSLYDKRTGMPDVSTPVLEINYTLETGLEDARSRRHPGLPLLQARCALPRRWLLLISADP